MSETTITKSADGFLTSPVIPTTPGDVGIGAQLSNALLTPASILALGGAGLAGGAAMRRRARQTYRPGEEPEERRRRILRDTVMGGTMGAGAVGSALVGHQALTNFRGYAGRMEELARKSRERFPLMAGGGATGAYLGHRGWTKRRPQVRGEAGRTIHNLLSGTDKYTRALGGSGERGVAAAQTARTRLNHSFRGLLSEAIRNSRMADTAYRPALADRFRDWASTRSWGRHISDSASREAAALMRLQEGRPAGRLFGASRYIRGGRAPMLLPGAAGAAIGGLLPTIGGALGQKLLQWTQ